MAAFARAKRLTDLFLHAGDRTHPDAGGYASSGSEHDATMPFSGLLDGFFFEDTTTTINNNNNSATGDNPSDDEDDEHRRNSHSSTSLRSAAMVRDLVNKGGDQFKRDLVTDVLDTMSTHESLRGQSLSTFRRAVMGSLRESGYNAGICKSRWERSGGLTAGSHEYIDVVRSTTCGERYIVDVDFTAEFEIARRTEEYERVFRDLPRVFVGKAEELKQVVRIVAEEARKSMRARDMHVPPWRKARYMHEKWLGPYKRTTNSAQVSGTGGNTAPAVQCRSVGFEPVRFVVQPMGRTR